MRHDHGEGVWSRLCHGSRMPPQFVILREPKDLPVASDLRRRVFIARSSQVAIRTFSLTMLVRPNAPRTGCQSRRAVPSLRCAPFRMTCGYTPFRMTGGCAPFRMTCGYTPFRMTSDGLVTLQACPFNWPRLSVAGYHDPGSLGSRQPGTTESRVDEPCFATSPPMRPAIRMAR